MLRTTLTGRITQLEAGRGGTLMMLPALQAPARLELPHVRPAAVLAVKLGGQPLDADAGAEGLVLDLPAGLSAGTRLAVAYEPD